MKNLIYFIETLVESFATLLPLIVNINNYNCNYKAYIELTLSAYYFVLEYE
jgi:hypothetical protein